MKKQTLTLIFLLFTSLILQANTELKLSLNFPPERRQLAPTKPSRSSLEVRIENHFAESILTMTIPNNVFDDQIEATLTFELPENSVITGLKLGINNQMVSGVGVEWWKAFTAYEREVGRRVDPAIILKSRDKYQLKLYPIQSRDNRTVQITWIQPLIEQEGKLVYECPFYSGQILWNFIRISSAPDKNIEISDFRDSSFKLVRNEEIDTYEMANRRTSLPVHFTVTTEIDSHSDQYALQDKSLLHNKKLDELDVIWDFSYSRLRTRAQNEEIEALVKLCSELQVQRVNFYGLSYTIDKIKEINVENLREELNNIVYKHPLDGSSEVHTILDFLRTRESRPTVLVTQWLEYQHMEETGFFTNFGILTSNNNNRYYLYSFQTLSQTTGCPILRTDQLDNENKLNRFTYYLLKPGPDSFYVDYTDNKIIEFLNDDNKSPGLIETFPNYIEGLRTTVTGQVWAGENLDQHISQFNAVTNYSSLLVLETPEQYVKWDITPPDDVPWEKEIYFDLLEEKAKTVAETFDSHVENILYPVTAEVLDFITGDEIDQKRKDSFIWNEDSLEDIKTKWEIIEFQGGCFPAGTPIAIEDKAYVAIEEIKINQPVMTYDMSLGTVSESVVRQVHKKNYSGDMIHLVTEKGELRLTGNHPVFVNRKQVRNESSMSDEVSLDDQKLIFPSLWIAARDIVEGDLLMDSSGDFIEVNNVNSTQVLNIDVYNLSIAEHRTYFAGHQGILVHNKGQQESSSDGAAIPNGNENQSGNEFVDDLYTTEEYVKSPFREVQIENIEEAYNHYLDIRGNDWHDDSFFIDAGRWFVKNGYDDTALKVLSNLSEHHWWYRDTNVGDILQRALLYESIGEIERALEIINRDKESWTYLSISTLAYISELYSMNSRNDDLTSILKKYTPLYWNSIGREDSYGSDPLGGITFSLYLDNLLYTENIQKGNEEEVFLKESLRIRSIWPGYSNISLIVVEPNNEAVFHDNFQSQSGGLYWTNYSSTTGPDEYLSLSPPKGIYELYLYKPENRYAYEGFDMVRTSVSYILNGTKEIQKVFITDFAKEKTLQKIGEIEIP